MKFWFLTQNDNNILLFSHQIFKLNEFMKHHLPETHKVNFETHNIVLSSQTISYYKVKEF